FVVVEREQIAQILKEQGLGMTGAISPQTAAKAGKLLGLQAIVTGKITDFDESQKTGGFGGYYQSHERIATARGSLPITDPTTGAVIGHELGKTLGHLQLAEHLNEKLSVCVATQGATFAAGDMVTLDASKAADTE